MRLEPLGGDHEWDPKFEAPGGLLGLLGGGLFKGGASQEPTVRTKRYDRSGESQTQRINCAQIVTRRRKQRVVTMGSQI